MKATMDAQGCITLKAESAVEAYALSKWTKDYFPQNKLVGSVEEAKERQSYLLIDADYQ